MLFAVALTGSRVRGGTVNQYHTCFIVEAFNHDEAVGIAHRCAEFSYPNPWIRHVNVGTAVLDPSKPLEDQLPPPREDL